jgi:nickel transport protein
VLLALLLGAAPALAHKLNVFAAADGAGIEGSAYFVGGAKAFGARILVTDATGSVLAELEPAADGSFSYQASAPVDHRIIAETGDGHRAEWRVTAEELAGGFPSRTTDVQQAAAERGAAEATEAAKGPVGGEVPDSKPEVLAPDIAAAIERAVARQVRPLREELLATRDALRLQDILGGIGYIFGLAGLALWWRSRQPTDRG